MVGGQYLDVTDGGRRDPESLRLLHCAEDRPADRGERLLGAGPGGPRRTRRQDPYRRFAAELGLLFQIVDDILDVTGTDEELGKPQGSDERHGKLTYVSLLRARPRARAGRPSRTPQALGGARRGRRRDRRPRSGSPTSSSPASRDGSRRASQPATIRDRAYPPIPTRHQLERSARSERLLDQVDGPADLNGLDDPAAPAGRAGGPRADHRHDRRDRRPLRRQPRHLRARGRAPQPARLPARQDPLGRRPPGLPAQDPDRPQRPARHDPPVRRPRAVLLDPGVRARHHGRRPRLDLDRLRGRPQGGDAPRDRRGRQGRRGDRRRRADRRRRLRGAPARRRPRDAGRDRPQRQRHVDLAERRRALPLLQPRPAQPAPLPRPRGRRGAADAPADGPRPADRAARPRDQVRDQGLLGAGAALRGARPRLHGRHRRPRRRRPALGAAQALAAERPVVVHIHTVKGKGFAAAEEGGLEGMEEWHAAKPGSIVERKPAKSKAPSPVAGSAGRRGTPPRPIPGPGVRRARVDRAREARGAAAEAVPAGLHLGLRQRARRRGEGATSASSGSPPRWPAGPG